MKYLKTYEDIDFTARYYDNFDDEKPANEEDFMLFEENNWSKNRIRSFFKEKQELEKLLELFIIEERLIKNEKLLGINEFGYNKRNKRIFIDCSVKTISKTFLKETILIDGEILNKFYNFIEDPELYLSSKKYNL